MQFKELIQKIGFLPKENSSGMFYKKYPECDNYCIEIDVENEKFNYGKLIIAGAQTTLNFSQAENWVVLECVDRLLEKGYKPENISLEKVYPAGHGFSGRLDICVTREDGSEYLLIECKTYGKEFDKAVSKLNKDGGQLFTYFKFSNKADVIMLYASELNDNAVLYKNEIVKIEDDYRTGDVKDFYDKWNKLAKDNGVFDTWVNPYQFVSKALTLKLLEPIKQEDSSFIFNRFLEILRHNIVSDKPNAFNKIFTLFLCKIYDEKNHEGTENELDFQWKEGIDNDVSFQLRLTDLYKSGMLEFLEKNVTDFSESEFEKKFKGLDDDVKTALLTEFKKIRLEKNNEFAIKEVYDEKSFKENAKVVKEVVELLQGYKIRYTKKQQYLSDFFELLLTTGLKQESGQFFTPVPIAQFIIKSLPVDLIVEGKLQKAENNNLLPFVMDYAAGSGHFLTEAMHEIQRLIDQKDDKKYNPSTAKKIRNWKDDHFDWALDYIYGIEKDYRLVKVGKVGCYLHGDGLANVLHTDGLANFNHADYKGKLKHTDKDFPADNKQFDILVSNPPYSVSAFKNASREYYRENDFDLYGRLTDNSSEIECLFIERTKQLLKDGGVAGIILPNSILNNAGIYSKAREIILQYFDIIAIAELGSNTFMATGTNTVTLFLRRRDNYESINLKIAVDKFFMNLRDVTLNGIEKPAAKYIQHVWESISFDDYVSLLQKTPTKAIEQHEIFLDYKKKIKAKNEKEFWDTVLGKENEKLYYFIIVLPQKTVLVKSGEKDEEKLFLGYEFSNRRGSEGIHAVQRGKNIEECTSLFDPDVFDNPSKASTYIYKAFNRDFDFPITDEMKKNITRHQLVDLIAFDRVEFEKNISLSIKKKVKIESKWQIKKLSEVSILDYGTRIVKKEEGGQYFPVYGGGGETFKANSFNRRNTYIISRFGMSPECVRFVDGEFFLNDSGMTINSLDSNILTPQYLNNYLYTNQQIVYSCGRGVAQKNMDIAAFNQIQIPLPPKDIQEKIAVEINILQEKEKKAINEKQFISEKMEEVLTRLFVSQELVPVQSIALNTQYGLSKPLNSNEKGFKTFRMMEIAKAKMVDNNQMKYSDIDESEFEKYKLKKGDILFNRTNSIELVGKSGIFNLEGDYCFASYLIRIKIDEEKAHPLFISKIMNTKVFLEMARLHAAKAVKQANINAEKLKSFKIPLPPLPLQQKIVAEIEIAETKIAELEEEIASIPQKKELIFKKYL